MARTPIASRNQIDPVFSGGYESNKSGEMVGHIMEEADFQSPIDLTSGTPTHVRFVEVEPNQLAEIPLAIRQLAEPESQLREASIIIKEEQVHNLQKP